MSQMDPDYYIKRREFFRKEGWCTACGRARPAKDALTCARCAEMSRQRVIRFRKKRKKKTKTRR